MIKKTFLLLLFLPAITKAQDSTVTVSSVDAVERFGMLLDESSKNDNIVIEERTSKFDVILKKDGTEIIAKIISVSKNEINFKKINNLEGPLYILSTNEVFMIKYANGEKEIFEDLENKNIIANECEQYIEALPDSNNIKLISMINSEPDNADKKKNRKTGAIILAAFMGVTESSVLSTKELEVSFDRSFHELGAMKGETVYNIILKNKTESFLYIDKSNCFIIDKQGMSAALYSPNEISKTTGNNIGGGISLGTISNILGINGIVGTILNGTSVNGGISNYTTVTEKEQQYITIPPKSKLYLVKGLKIPLFFCEKKSIKIGECKTFTYSESPMKWSYIITYSKDKNFRNFSSINIQAYCKYLYGYMGQPIGGCNLVQSGMLIYPCQVYSTFNCKNEKVTKYNKWKPNVYSIEE